MVRNLTILVVLAALAWSGWWFWSAHALRGELDRAVADLRDDGWEVSYSNRSIRGFPNRLDTTFTDLAVASPDGDTRWQAPFFQLLQLSYKPGHIIAVWPQDQTLTRDGNRYVITDEDMRASLIFDAQRRVIRSNLEAARLTVTPDGGTAQTLQNLNGALQWVDTAGKDYRIALTADSLGTPGNAAAEDLKADLTVTLSAPLTFGAQDEKPRPERIDIRTLEQLIAPMTLALSGDLDVDSGGRLDGKISLTARQWRGYLDKRAASGAMTEGVQASTIALLELVSALSGGGDNLDVTIRFRDGNMSLGLLPLGPAPRLRLP